MRLGSPWRPLLTVVQCCVCQPVIMNLTNTVHLVFPPARNQAFDVVLVDTAGRMQDNAPLMTALAKLIAVNMPDLVLFVGEALVGNEAVDQLVRPRTDGDQTRQVKFSCLYLQLTSQKQLQQQQQRVVRPRGHINVLYPSCPAEVSAALMKYAEPAVLCCVLR